MLYAGAPHFGMGKTKYRFVVDLILRIRFAKYAINSEFRRMCA